MTPEQQKKFYATNKADALAKEKAKDYEIFGSRGAAAVRGMEEGRMDAMGNAYKKGGKVKVGSHGFKAGATGKNKHGF
jgi:hypothetical protein